MAIIGVDPGAQGAVALLDESGQLIDVWDIPSTREKNGRVVTNPILLADIIARTNARILFCEFVAARPTDAKTAAFQFGRARGIIEGICGSFNIPIEFITPPDWKRIAGVPPGEENKDVARTVAISKWPHKAELFRRKGDCDRADAALIGWAKLQKELRHVKLSEVA